MGSDDFNMFNMFLKQKFKKSYYLTKHIFPYHIHIYCICIH